MDEEANGGHAIEDHVGESDDYLKRRVRQTRLEFGPFGAAERVGSFPSLQAAEKLVNSTISQNKAIVDQVASGEIGIDRHVRINAWFDSPTGKEAYAPNARAQPEIRVTTGVAVVLRHDRNASRGYSLISTFPVNR